MKRNRYIAAYVLLAFCFIKHPVVGQNRSFTGTVTIHPVRLEDRIFCAYDRGLFKPDPGLFLDAAANAGVAPEWCLVVGRQSARYSGRVECRYARHCTNGDCPRTWSGVSPSSPVWMI